MVGTIEPRKGYLQTLNAFDQLWRDGVDVNLVIVGREGWKDLPDNMRRDIPKTVERLRSHPELNQRLFWLEGISDEYLEKVYATSTCLIAASYGEGFGLPLIEAAMHNTPVIASDIPVFHEVAGDGALYFSLDDPDSLIKAIIKMINLSDEERKKLVSQIKRLTWKESAENLLDLILGNKLNSLSNDNYQNML
jgi:glycosyltransferase involved in cell wall biosynthesis